jgi:hypothetical protein
LGLSFPLELSCIVSALAWAAERAFLPHFLNAVQEAGMRFQRRAECTPTAGKENPRKRRLPGCFQLKDWQMYVNS